MSAKFLALVVLLKLFGVGQAVNLEHVQDSISSKAVQTDGTSKDARLDEMTLKSFTWTYSATDSITSLAVCTEQPFAGNGQTVQQVTLLTTINGGPEENCETAVVDAEQKCATFTGTGNCNIIIPSGDVTYKLVIEVTGLLLVGVNRSGTASFTMKVEAATLTCGSTSFIRATGVTRANTETCEATGVDGICYKSGNLALEPFCFTAIVSSPLGLTLCLGGDNYHSQEVPDGELTITQLAYTTAGSATFSLTHGGSDSTEFEAIVLKKMVPLQSCYVTPVAASSGTCAVSDFSGDYAEYEVCTITPALESFQTASSSITDLDFRAEEGLTALEFRFTNANPDMKYVAKLDNDLPEAEPPTVNIDCSGVSPDHLCYGFIGKSPTHQFLTVEYLAADGSNSNKISILNPGFGALSELAGIYLK